MATFSAICPGDRHTAVRDDDEGVMAIHDDSLWFVIARRNLCFDAAIQCALANSGARQISSQI